MKCPECNAEIETGERFCGSCGYDLSSTPPERLVETPLGTTADIQIICAQCGAALTRDKKFCGSCGQPVVLEPARPKIQSCPYCGTPADPGEGFCGSCGRALRTAPLKAEAPPVLASPHRPAAGRRVLAWKLSITGVLLTVGIIGWWLWVDLVPLFGTRPDTPPLPPRPPVLSDPGTPSPDKAIIGQYEIMYQTSVYREPRDDAPIIVHLAAGSKVNVVEARGEWLEIRSRHGRPPGFVKKDAAAPLSNR